MFHRFSWSAAALAAALLVPSTANAYCGNTVKNNAHSKCVTVIRVPLPVYNSKGDLICKFRVGRSFWAPRRAGYEDGQLYYSVRLKGVGTGTFAEVRNGRKTIRDC